MPVALSMQDGHRPPTRRTVIRGAAWAIPVVTMSSITPAFAASGLLLSASITGNGSTSLVTTTRTVTCETAVQFAVQGGSGGSGGRGAVYTGAFYVPAGTTLTLIAGGQGDPAYASSTLSTVLGGKGYGNGGNSSTTPLERMGGGVAAALRS